MRNGLDKNVANINMEVERESLCILSIRENIIFMDKHKLQIYFMHFIAYLLHK